MPCIVAVVGATGNQGGSVAQSLLQNPSFKVHAITRNSSSEASQALASSRAEVAQANGFNSKEMLRAFNDVWGLFVNLNSDDKIWSNPDGPTKFDLGRKIVDATAQASVQYFVFSSGPPCSEMTEGKMRMKAMERIEQHAKQPGKFQTVTPINAAWHLGNFLVKEIAPVFGGFPHFPNEEGYLTFRVPNWDGDNKVPFLSITNDYGDIVQGIFLDPARWNGHVVHGASQILGFDQLVANFKDGEPIHPPIDIHEGKYILTMAVTGKKSRFQPILPSWEAFNTHRIHKLEDVKLTFAFTQITSGCYFVPKLPENNTASELKRATAAALGRPEGQQGLVTVKDWFQSRFV